MSRGRQAGSLRNRFRLYLATLIMVIPAVTSSIAHAAVNYCMPLMKDAMSRTKVAVVFQQSPSSKSLLDVKEIPANGSSN